MDHIAPNQPENPTKGRGSDVASLGSLLDVMVLSSIQ
jgi:hypothetical protein